MMKALLLGSSEADMPIGGASIKRGALIVLEGCDKAGKSTHSKLLIEALNSNGRRAGLINFPDRSTEIGKMIDAYLRCQKEVKDEVIHLLFSANRWELAPRIKEMLMNGETVVLDRYAYSGVAFSAAKGTMDLEWCISPDVGLPRPDRVIFLDLTESEASIRGDFGNERYETTEFQRKVKQLFYKLKEKDDSKWSIIETNRPKEQVHHEILHCVLETIKNSQETPILELWSKMRNLQLKESPKITKTSIHTTV